MSNNPAARSTGSAAAVKPPIIVNEIIEDHTQRKVINNLTGKAQLIPHCKRYNRLNKLGKGGFAVCYSIQSQDSNRLYACKVVSKQSLVKPSSKLKLMNEINIHKTLNHKNVVKFERFFEDSQNVYILLELCSNQTLMELVKRRGRLTEPEVQYYMMQLIDTCHYLHKQNIIHRDLKLGNLFLHDSMEIKVGDFGLATQLSFNGERKKTICGTPNYIAPEILDNHMYEGHSFEVDTWALGVIMFTMLIGQPPFETQAVKTTYNKIRKNEYEFPKNITISSAAKSLVQRILQTNPNHRPSLESVRNDPFFTQSAIPASLPASAMTIPPNFKQKILDQSSNASEASKVQENQFETMKSSKALSNHNSPSSKLIQPSSVAAAPPAPVPAPASAANFIRLPFNDKQGVLNNKQNMKAAAEINQLASTMKKLTLDKPASPEKFELILDGASSYANSNNPSPQHDNSLKKIHDEIEKSFSKMNPNQVPIMLNAAEEPSAINSAEELWVGKWVDYSNKYGLGYLLSNGSSGVYFNDSTKAILNSEQTSFDYIDRKNNNSTTKQTYSIENYPIALTKKVTLLKHFSNYLLQSKDKSAAATSSNAGSKSSSCAELVYVKKWLRTKHAIFFRLSNRTVQVIFLDQTELVLSSLTNNVYYTDKNKHKTSYSMDSSSAIIQQKPDLAKRMKYTKDILQHLLNSNNSNNSPSTVTNLQQSKKSL
jgi:polo-like kinase 1